LFWTPFGSGEACPACEMDAKKQCCSRGV
jgi:hypothetical protein